MRPYQLHLISPLVTGAEFGATPELRSVTPPISTLHILPLSASSHFHDIQQSAGRDSSICLNPLNSILAPGINSPSPSSKDDASPPLVKRHLLL